MSSQQRAARRFQIERLEERIVPDCLFWQGALLDGVIPLGAALGQTSARTPHSVKSARIAALRASLAQSNAEMGGASAEQQPMLPAWAEDFLGQIERELEKTSAASVIAASTNPDEKSSRLDALLAKVDRKLSEAVVPDAPQATDTAGSLPPWAEELLLEIRQEMAHS